MRCARELPFGRSLTLISKSDAQGWVRLAATLEDGVREVMLWRAGGVQVCAKPHLAFVGSLGRHPVCMPRLMRIHMWILRQLGI